MPRLAARGFSKACAINAALFRKAIECFREMKESRRIRVCNCAGLLRDSPLLCLTWWRTLRRVPLTLLARSPLDERARFGHST
jgi:hypothetical protein